eukprot:10454468-Lingulodinium_polyedra.AAC.1
MPCHPDVSRACMRVTWSCHSLQDPITMLGWLRGQSAPPRSRGTCSSPHALVLRGRKGAKGGCWCGCSCQVAADVPAARQVSAIPICNVADAGAGVGARV